MGAQGPTDDERAGMAWWNAMSEVERDRADRGVCTVGRLYVPRRADRRD